MKKGMIICVISFLCVSLFSMYQKLVPLMKEYGKMEIERFNQLIVNHCYGMEEGQYEDLVMIERKEDGEISLIDFDMVKANHLATLVVYDIEKTYASIEEGTYQREDDSYYARRLEEVSKSGIIASITPSILFHIPFPSFPSFPIQYKHLSSVGGSIIKNIENYGVNHVMVELSIEITMSLSMTSPFFEQYHSHKIKIPVLLEIIEGQIPLVYNQ